MSFAAIVTGLGPGLVSRGYGGGIGGYAAATQPGVIVIRERSRRLHPGDIAEIDLDLMTYDDEYVDPSVLTVDVRPPAGDDFEIAYGGGDTIDRITRRDEGRYTLYVDLLSERGVGIFQFTVRATGALQATEPGQFILRAVRL